MTLTILITILSLRLTAPIDVSIVIGKDESIQPYEAIWTAVCKVESGGNPFAIGDRHMKHYSYGIAQIRQERLNDYNKQTDNSYKLTDMFDIDISKEIFMYYANQFNIYQMDDLIRAWNGSGKQTYIYLHKVKQCIER